MGGDIGDGGELACIIVYHNDDGAGVPDHRWPPNGSRIRGIKPSGQGGELPAAATITTQLRTIRGKFTRNLRGF